MEKCLADAGLQGGDLSDVVLVGGTSRMPRTQAMLKKVIGGKEPLRSINPDEAVAYGAALQASKLSGNCGPGRDDFCLEDVTPLSLGVGVKGDLLSVIIPKNSRIPCRREKGNFSTCEDYQKVVRWSMYEGERPVASENHFLGSFLSEDIVPVVRDAASFDVTFNISSDGIFRVEARDKLRNETKAITIQSRQLSSEQVERMVRDAQEHEEQDRRRERTARARNRLEDHLYDMETELRYGIVLHAAPFFVD